MNRLAQAVGLAGAPTAGILLFRLAYWQPRASIEFDARPGLPWVAKTRDEWGEETGLSLKQYKSALRALQVAGLVETVFAFFAGRRVTHMRLSGDALALVDPDGPADTGAAVPYGTTRAGPYGTTHGRAHTGPAITPDTSTDTDHEEVPKGDQDMVPKYEPVRPKRGRTVSEVASSPGRTPEDLARCKPTPANMRMLWEACHRRAYPGMPVGGWSGKDSGMMKNFARQCAEAGIDPMAAIVDAVTGWPSFRERVRADSGRKVPDMPTVWPVAINARVFTHVTGSGYDGPPKRDGGSETVTYIPPGSKDY